MKTLLTTTAIATLLATSAIADDQHWSKGYGDPVQAMTSASAAKHYAETSGRFTPDRLSDILASIGSAKRRGVIGYVFDERNGRSTISPVTERIRSIIKSGVTSRGVTYTQQTSGGQSKTVGSDGSCYGQGCN